MSDDDFMAGLVAAKDVDLLTEDDLPWDDNDQQKQKNNIVVQQGEALWSYRYENKINGIVVADGDRNLAIERDADL